MKKSYSIFKKQKRKLIILNERKIVNIKYLLKKLNKPIGLCCEALLIACRSH